jgi:hypothetical protein
MATAGYTYEQIAEELGYANRGTAYTSSTVSSPHARHLPRETCGCCKTSGSNGCCRQSGNEQTPATSAPSLRQPKSSCSSAACTAF